MDVKWMINSTVTKILGIRTHALSCKFNQNNLVTISYTYKYAMQHQVFKLLVKLCITNM